MSRFLFLLYFCLIVILFSSEVSGQAYHAAKIYQPGKAVLSDAYLVVDEGKVVKVCLRDELPPLMPVIELGEAHIMPGLVAADSTVVGASRETDLSMAAHHHSYDNFDPWLDYSKVLEHGVTTFYLSPNRNRLIGGRGAVVKSAGSRRDLLTKGDLRINLTPSALNPPDFFRPPIPPTAENPLLPSERQAPTSLPGASRALRLAYSGVDNDSGGLANSRGLQDWRKSNQPLRIVVDNADQARVAINLAREWSSPLVLQGLARATSENFLALKDKPSICLVEIPMYAQVGGPSDYFDLDSNLLNTISESSMFALKPGPYASWVLLLEAATIARGFGVSEESALQSVTSVPAELLGVGERVGKLESGYDADFVVLDGAPFEAASSVREVYIDGALVWERESVKSLSDNDAVVLRAGTLWTGDGAPLTGGVEVLLQDSRIIAAGHSVPYPMGAHVVDAGADAHITPGLIDSRGFAAINNSRIPASVDISKLNISSYFSDNWNHVASQGITSVVLGPGGISSSGSRAEVIKTSVMPGDFSSVADRSVVFFDGNISDRAKGSDLAKQLERGKKYADEWVKYREERAKWESENTLKKQEEREKEERELRIRLAQEGVVIEEDSAEEDSAEEGEEEGEEETPEEDVKVDPLNGLWEGTIEDERFPESVTINVYLRHEGRDVTAILSSPDDPSGETLEVEGGVYENDTIHFEFPTEVGTVMIDGVIDAPDTMSVTVSLAGIGSIDFVMTRIEIEQPGGFKPKRKKGKKEDGPQPPSVDPRYEGVRHLLEGRGVAVISANRIDEIRSALDIFSSYDFPINVMGIDYSLELKELLHQYSAGYLMSADTVVRNGRADEVPATYVQADGVPLAFYTNKSKDSAFMVPAMKLATSYGLGAEQALLGLTSQAADILGVADRIGRVKPGLDADIVIFTGAPFDLKTRVHSVYVQGKEVRQ